LNRLSVIDLDAQDLKLWFSTHVGTQLSSREKSLRKKQAHAQDPLMSLKDSIHTIFIRSAGLQGGAPQRMFAFGDMATTNCDTVLFVNNLKFDQPSHTILCDAFVLPLDHNIMPIIEPAFFKAVREYPGEGMAIKSKGELQLWKQLLPALVERSRFSWNHGDNCEYKAIGKIPLTIEVEQSAICSCGRGKDVEAMMDVELWRELAPYVTRVALSPFFAVSYLETVIRNPENQKCFLCRGKGKPKLMVCKRCQKVRYCSKQCQTRDWQAHKERCKPSL